MGTSLQSMIPRWTGFLIFLAVLHLVCCEEHQKEEDEKPQEEAEAKQPWLGSLLGLTRRDVRADKDDMFWATRGKRTPDDFWAIRGKKEYIKPNGFFQPLSTQKPGKRSFKPNGLFSTMKKSSLKPNSLFTAYKRGGFKPNGLFGTYKRSTLKPNGLFGSIKRDWSVASKRPSLKPNGLFGAYKRAGLKPNGLFGAYKRKAAHNDLVELTKEHLVPIDFGWEGIEDDDETMFDDEYQEYLKHYDEHYHDDEYDNEPDFEEQHAEKREDAEFWLQEEKRRIQPSGRH